MPDIVCISPVDGREVVRRAASSAAEIEAAVAAARKAQAEWKRVSSRGARENPVAGGRRHAGDARRGRAGAGMADGPPGALRRQRAWRLRGTRARHDRAGRDRARRHRSGAEGGLQALRRARAGRHRAHGRAVELSVSDGGEFGRAGADGRQCGDPQACRADAAGRRPLPGRDGQGRTCRKACSAR